MLYTYISKLSKINYSNTKMFSFCYTHLNIWNKNYSISSTNGRNHFIHSFKIVNVPYEQLWNSKTSTTVRIRFADTKTFWTITASRLRLIIVFAVFIKFSFIHALNSIISKFSDSSEVFKSCFVIPVFMKLLSLKGPAHTGLTQLWHI